MNTFLKTTFLSTFLLFTAVVCHAQDSQVFIQRSIEFNGGTEKEEVIIYVEEGSGVLQVHINATINMGKLSVEIFDSKGVSKGKFSIGSQIVNSDKVSETVRGTISKTIENPDKGEWKIKLTPENAKANVRISITQAQ